MLRFGKLLACVVVAGALSCASAAGASANALPAGMAWSGDGSTGDLSQWKYVEQCPGDVSVVGSPAPAGGHAFQLSVNDGDTSSRCPGHVFTPQPAASLISPTLFHNGDDAWIGESLYLPVGFPYIPHWFQFAELDGAPFGGSPPVGLDIEGNHFGLYRDATHNFDAIWNAPVVTGAWQDFVLHVKFSNDPTVGFVELYYNGVQQQFADGSTRDYYATLVAGNNWDGASGGNFLDLDQYRSGYDDFGTLTIYEAEPSIGSSYAAVAPSLHSGILSAPTSAPALPPGPKTTDTPPARKPPPSTTPTTPVSGHTARTKHPRRPKRRLAPKRTARRPARTELPRLEATLLSWPLTHGFF